MSVLQDIKNLQSAREAYIKNLIQEVTLKVFSIGCIKNIHLSQTDEKRVLDKLDTIFPVSLDARVDGVRIRESAAMAKEGIVGGRSLKQFDYTQQRDGGGLGIYGIGGLLGLAGTSAYGIYESYQKYKNNEPLTSPLDKAMGYFMRTKKVVDESTGLQEDIKDYKKNIIALQKHVYDCLKKSNMMAGNDDNFKLSTVDDANFKQSITDFNARANLLLGLIKPAKEILLDNPDVKITTKDGRKLSIKEVVDNEKNVWNQEAKHFITKELEAEMQKAKTCDANVKVLIKSLNIFKRVTIDYARDIRITKDLVNHAITGEFKYRTNQKYGKSPLIDSVAEKLKGVRDVESILRIINAANSMEIIILSDYLFTYFLGVLKDKKF